MNFLQTHRKQIVLKNDNNSRYQPIRLQPTNVKLSLQRLYLEQTMFAIYNISKGTFSVEVSLYFIYNFDRYDQSIVWTNIDRK
jgi:hypothetical protein